MLTLLHINSPDILNHNSFTLSKSQLFIYKIKYSFCDIYLQITKLSNNFWQKTNLLKESLWGQRLRLGGYTPEKYVQMNLSSSGHLSATTSAEHRQ